MGVPGTVRRPSAYALDKPANLGNLPTSVRRLGQRGGSRQAPSEAGIDPEDARHMADTAPYHDRDGFIWYDGKLVPWREANLHVLSHGLHYASAVFEGERAYGGRDLRADPAQPASLRGRQDAGLHHPLQRRRDRPGLPRHGQGQQADRLLRAPDRLARQRDDGRLGPGDQDPPGRRRLGLGLLLPDGAAPEGLCASPSPSIAGPIPRPRRPRPRPPAST